jgi:CRISPR-associated helicase Cas3
MERFASCNFSIGNLTYPVLKSDRCADSEKDAVSSICRVSKLQENGQPRTMYPHPYQVETLLLAREMTSPGSAGGIIFLCSHTGSGKSLACSLPSLLDGKKTIYTYPTNELLHEQRDSFSKYCIDGIPYETLVLDGRMAPYEFITSQSINEKFKEMAGQFESIEAKRAWAAAELLRYTKNAFTTVDIVYYAISSRYGRVLHGGSKGNLASTPSQDSVDVHNAVFTNDIYVFDEYDSYDRKMKDTITSIITYIVHPDLTLVKRPRCIILSSATPDLELKSKFDKMGIRTEIVRENDVTRSGDARQIMPSVTVDVWEDPKAYKDMPYVKNVFSINDGAFVDEIVHFYHENPGKTIVIISDSLFNDCKAVASILKGRLGNDVVGEINGTTVRDFEFRKSLRNEKRVLVGNRSIDLGIDFKRIDWLIMTAPDISHLKQRLGRLRGGLIGDGNRRCTMIVPANVSSSMTIWLSKNFPGIENPMLSRDQLDDMLDTLRDDKAYRYTNQYWWYTREYAPLEFLKIITDVTGGFDDGWTWKSYSMEKKKEIESTVGKVFPALFGSGADLDTFLERKYNKMLLGVTRPKYMTATMFELIFMSFRNHSVLPVIVKDNFAHPRSRYFVYDGLMILRRGNVVGVHEIYEKNGTRRIAWNDDLDRAFKSFEMHDDIWYSGRNAKIIIEINGYNDKYNPIGIELQQKTILDRLRVYKDKFDDFSKLPSYTIDDGVVMKGLPYAMTFLGGIKLHRKSWTEHLDKINRQLSRESFIAYVVMDTENKYKSEEDAFQSINYALSLPLFDQSMPLRVIGDGDSETWGAIGLNHAGLLLECAVKQRDWYLKKK